MQPTLTRAVPELRLKAVNASELMRPNPVSLRDDATVQEALDLFTTRGISAAPVIDEAGRPLGVLSHSDIMVHERVAGQRPAAGKKAAPPAAMVRVRDLMTPSVFSVNPDTPSARVVEDLLALKVHRLFVVDALGVLVGVISAVDVLRHLRP
jgi:CBS domain-containing protein